MAIYYQISVFLPTFHSGIRLEDRPFCREEMECSECWSKNLKAVKPEFPVEVHRQGKPSLRTRNVLVSPVANALLRISDRFDLGLTMTDRDGNKCTAIVEAVEVQTGGEIRSTLLLRGAFHNLAGRRVVGFRMLASVFAGLSKVYPEPQILIDSEKDVIHQLRNLTFTATPLRAMISR